MQMQQYLKSPLHVRHSLLAAVLLGAILFPMSIWAGQTISIKPSDDVESIVNNSPLGTTFQFAVGVYRLLEIRPKTGDVFLGSASAVLNGSTELTNFMRAGNNFVSPYAQPQGQLNGSCMSQAPMCQYTEDLFFDDKLLVRVSSASQVAPGKWFLDYANHLLIFADDPMNHVVEISTARSAFSGPASNVTIQGFTVEKYAIPAQMGAIGDQFPGKNWRVTRCIVRLNHGAGIHVLGGSSVVKNVVTQNGQLGIGASGSNVVIQGNEVSFNNTAGFDAGWEAGGTKFSATTNLMVQANYVHDNNGPGLWTDIENTNTLYDRNVVTNNAGEGIKHEISFAATIQNNVVSNNGNTSAFLWGSQILVQNSSSVEVKNNVVTVSAKCGNGIGIINQNRGLSSKGQLLSAHDNYIHDNNVTYSGQSGTTGLAADYDPDGAYAANNKFESNHYHAPNVSNYNWQWRGMQKFGSFQSFGQDQHGSVDTQTQ